MDNTGIARSSFLCRSPGFVLLSLGILLSYVSTSEVSFDRKANKEHGILHCELKPHVCSVLCTTAFPTCELAGNCVCKKPPSSDLAECREPEGVEAKRCHKGLCFNKLISKPLICEFKKFKVCACFPPT